MNLDSLSLDELYKLRDVVSLRIHQRRHDAADLTPAMILPCISFWNSVSPYQLATDLHIGHITLELKVVNTKIVFYCLDKGRPLLVSGGIKYWDLTRAGIEAAQPYLGVRYDKAS
jgi:hypothetical protein